MVLMLVNCSERKNPPTSSSAQHGRDRRGLREAGTGGHESGADQGIENQDGAEAEALEQGRRRHFHGHGAGRRGEGDQARLKGGHAKADLKHQRQQERQRADAQPEHEAAQYAGAECRQAKQREVERRGRRVPRVDEIGHDENRAGDDQRDDGRSRAES